MRYLMVVILLSSFLMAACGSDSDGAKRQIKIFVAASMAEAAQEAADALEKTYPDYDFEIHAGGSQLLEAQIRKSSSASVFLSADHQRLAALVSDGLAMDQSKLCANRLVLVVQEESDLRNVMEIAKPGVRLAMAGEAVPVGKLSTLALHKLGIEAPAKANLISEESSVTQVKVKLDTKQADAGFVYATNLRQLKGVRELSLGDAAQVSECGIANLDGSELAKIFYDFMLSPEGQAILKARGFTTD